MTTGETGVGKAIYSTECQINSSRTQDIVMEQDWCVLSFAAKVNKIHDDVKTTYRRHITETFINTYFFINYIV